MFHTNVGLRVNGWTTSAIGDYSDLRGKNPKLEILIVAK